MFLQQWARDHNIRFMLFDPSKCVRDGLKRVRATSEFYIPTLDDMMALLTYADSQYAAALTIEFVCAALRMQGDEFGITGAATGTVLRSRGCSQ